MFFIGSGLELVSVRCFFNTSLRNGNFKSAKCINAKPEKLHSPPVSDKFEVAFALLLRSSLAHAAAHHSARNILFWFQAYRTFANERVLLLRAGQWGGHSESNTPFFKPVAQ